MLFADLGAEVIKIEKPGIGESSREMPPYFFEDQSAYFIAMNRNKKSMTLDLKSDQGKRIFYELAKHSDVVVDNFRPGVVKKLGLGFDDLKKINPRIICCSISGYGQTGPFKERPAFDLVVQARGGIMSYTGEPDRMPVRMGAPLGDLAGGLFASQGILAALYQREKTGRGQQIDISLVDCQTSLLTYRAQFYLVGKEIAIPSVRGTSRPTRSGPFKPRPSPSSSTPTRRASLPNCATPSASRRWQRIQSSSLGRCGAGTGSNSTPSWRRPFSRKRARRGWSSWRNASPLPRSTRSTRPWTTPRP